MTFDKIYSPSFNNIHNHFLNFLLYWWVQRPASLRARYIRSSKVLTLWGLYCHVCSLRVGSMKGMAGGWRNCICDKFLGGRRKEKLVALLAADIYTNTTWLHTRDHLTIHPIEPFHIYTQTDVTDRWAADLEIGFVSRSTQRRAVIWLHLQGRR
jgi:hypothetical protein